MSKSPLTRQQRQMIRYMAKTLDDATLRATAQDQRRLAAMQQAQAALWLRLDKFRRHGKGDSGDA